jgi:hypothetical protein
MVSVRAYPGKPRDGSIRTTGEAFATRFATQNGTDLGTVKRWWFGDVSARGEGEDGWMSKDHSKIEFLS